MNLRMYPHPGNVLRRVRLNLSKMTSLVRFEAIGGYGVPNMRLGQRTHLFLALDGRNITPPGCCPSATPLNRRNASQYVVIPFFVQLMA